MIRILGLWFAIVALSGCSMELPGDGNNLGGPTGPDDQYSADEPEYFREYVGDRVFFDSDESLITPTSARILDDQARWLNERRTLSIIIEGHTDERGTREYNLGLGARRASAVRDYLVEAGIEEHRISTATFGKERPQETCSAESCWSLNRRAVTTLGTSATLR